MFRIDHVVLAVGDLDASAARLWDEHGLRFAPGGHHPRWGTANMIAPLGRDYVELLGVVDPDVASTTVLGRTIAGLTQERDRWFSVCLADDDLERTATRLGLSVEPRARTRPDGVQVRWRGAGIEERGEELGLPFFITWDVLPELHPGAAATGHRVPAEGIARAEVGGDEERLREWLGGDEAPIRVVEGEPRLLAVAIAVAGGSEIVLRY
ncbi:MAG: VOC family protein [Gemmatimonadota bacterium]